MTARFALQISSGVGPLEVRRFAAALAEHLERGALAGGLVVEDVSCHGDPEAPRSVTLALRGDAVTVFLGQLGTHELVHRSPTRGRAARKRWFAAVSLHEQAAASGGRAVALDEVEVTVCRAGGPGGQHVNKVSSAVRVRHLASGLSVKVAGSRSQHANREQALARLAALLEEQAEREVRRGVETRRLAHYRVERGRPVRSYALGEDGALVPRSSGAAE